MSDGIPVRLSASLAARARSAATIQDRSLTEQVEHWARLGQLVETAVSASTVAKLKTQSHDPDLRSRLSNAHGAEAQAETARFIAARDPVRYGTDSRGAVVKVTKAPTPAKGTAKRRSRIR